MKLFFFLLAISSGVLAHQNTVSDSGKGMSLPNPVVGLELKNNPTYISYEQTSSIVQETFQQWNQTQANLKLSLTQANPHFQIQFDNSFDRYGPGVVGITEMSYSKEGQIQKAIIRLNNNTNLSSSRAAHVFGGIYLGDVLSHEIGHMVGLGHSEVLESTMYFESFPGQQSLAMDDIAGVRSLYSSGHGVISGTVMGGNQVPVLGAQVKAISRLSGEAVSAVSDENGKFFITGLDLNDSYYLYVSPTVKVNDLPPYYANTQNNFCPGSYKGGFFTACGVEEAGQAQAITLTHSRKSVDVGVVSISCELRSSPDYARSKVEEDMEPVLIWDSFSETVNERNQIGYFFKTPEWSKWDKFRIDLRNIPNQSADKKLRIGLINYSFGNLLEYELKVFQDEMEITSVGMRENLVTQTYSNNIFVEIPLDYLMSQNEYTVHIRARSLVSDCFETDGYCGRWVYPAVSLLTRNDQYPYLLTMGLYASGQPLFNTEQQLSDNVSCLQGPFTYAVERNIVHNEDEPMKKAAEQMSCGTIEPPSNSPPHQGLMSLCLGFMLACLSIFIKKDKKTLS